MQSTGVKMEKKKKPNRTGTDDHIQATGTRDDIST